MGESRRELTALPGVPDDQLLVVAHRAEDVRMMIVPGHILPETILSSEMKHNWDLTGSIAGTRL